MQLTNNFPFKTELDTLTVPISKLKLHNEFNINFNSTSHLTIPTEYSIGNDIFIPLSPSNSRLSVSICPLYEHEDEHEENISHQSRISHQPSNITSVTSDKTDPNLIMIDDYNQNSMSDSMSDDTETHNLSYSPHTIIHHDVLSPVSESQSESDQYIATLFENHSNRKCKRKNLNDIIVNHAHNKVQMQVRDKVAKQSIEIDDKLSHIICSMSSMNSNPEIMRLQEQLSNLSEKIKATQITRQMQLLNSFSLLSNRTQRIGCSNVSSYISSKTSDNNDYYNDMNREITPLDDNIATLIDVPSTPAFYGFNSLPQLQSPLNQPFITSFTPFTPSNITASNITPFTPSNQEIINTCQIPTMSAPCIDKYKNDYCVSNDIMFPDVNVDKMKKNKMNVDKISDDRNNNEKQKCKKKNNKKISCDNIAEMKLLKRKKKKKKKNGMCIWPSFKCFDLRVCIKKTKIKIKIK
eukprot:105011_1